MSSGEKKKRPPPSGVGKGKGWEEAGGEFYQESYPGAELDLEAMENDPHRISTLLPSKKSRTGTTIKDQKLITLRRTTLRSHYQTAVAPNNDIQIALLPDLSENLSNEKLLWEEIMKIKAMPVNMAQKKDMKAKLMSRDTLRLQGFKQFKWRNKKSWMQIKIRLKEMNEKLTLWQSSLKKIEGYYGAGVVSFFLFVKWLIFLNSMISFIMFVFIILPTIYVEHFAITAKPLLANFTTLDNASVYFINETVPEASVMNHMTVLYNVIFNVDWMTNSPLYYAFYTDSYLDFYYFRFHLPLAYIFGALMCFVYSFVALLRNAACSFKHKLLESQGQFYTYCNLVFSGWDFCIQNDKSAKIKHTGLYNEIVGRLNVERRKEELRNRTKQAWCKLVFVRILINLVILALLGVAEFVIYLAIKSSNEQNTKDQTWFVKLLVEFTPAGFITFFNLVFPFFFRWLATFENFSPIFTIQITIVRSILLRFSALCALLGSVYKVVYYENPRLPSSGYSWESELVRELYKLLILSVVMQILCTFLLNFPRSLLAKHCKNKCAQYFGNQEFDLSSHVLDVAYVQTIIWLGCFYAPMLPVIGVIIFVVLFYVKKFSCLVNCKPASNVYYVSRSQSMYMFILLLSFVFSVIPWMYSIVEISPSKISGPFKNYSTVWTVVEKTFSNFPNWVNVAMEFCLSTTFGIPLCVILLLTNYYYYAVCTVNKQMILVLKKQLILEGHDKQFLLNRLSAFIKQHQERYRPRNIEV